jgi:hypothetical protein
MRFEIEIELQSEIYEYAIAFDFPEGFRELRVFDERLIVGGRPIYTRELAQVHLARVSQEREAHFRIDWHLVALPIVRDLRERPFIHFQTVAPADANPSTNAKSNLGGFQRGNTRTGSSVHQLWRLVFGSTRLRSFGIHQD